MRPRQVTLHRTINEIKHQKSFTNQMISRNYPKYEKLGPKDFKAIRAGYRETQHEFARRFFSSPNTVKSWESGHRNISGPALVIMLQLRGKLYEWNKRRKA